MSDQQLKKKYGWSQDSRQLRTYSHLGLEALENAFRRHYGLADARESPTMCTKPCPFCHASNEPHLRFCAKCRRPLIQADAIREEGRDAALAELTADVVRLLANQNPDLKEKLKSLARENGMDELVR
jgi:hypothetical protein